LKDSGFDIEITKWRGVVAPPGLKDDDVKGIESFMRKVRDSSGWKSQLEKYGWTDFYKSGGEYKSFMDSETKRVKGIVDELGIGK
jgi:putative tricarboxylic transport membrane protein